LALLCLDFPEIRSLQLPFSRVVFRRGLTPALRGAALGISEALRKIRRPLEQLVRLAPERLAGRQWNWLLSMAFAALPKLSDGVTASRAMACASGREFWRHKA
jgi:hypothetical protein